ncbi:MAG: histidinol-phosphatase [Rhodobiaceae bacterium]|nr:histidinol-phosphatase [Rhodobiaceae bacterium]MCC0057202.1 histidinol-phosphatase [Rhodobiaceae bacterium]
MDRPALQSAFHQAADAAGAAIRPYFRSRFSTGDKGSDGVFDPVTEADRAAEEAIRAVIREKCPEDGIVGEEFPPHQGTNSRVWVIDPIDGTRSFLCGVPLFGTIIGLLDKGRPVAGLFDQPFTGERFFGDAGGSWFLRGDEHSRLGTRSTRTLADALMMTTSPHLFSAEERPCYSALEASVRLARYGADGYAYALLAAGQIDLVVEAGLQPYDIVGLIPVIEGAGGIVTAWDGSSAAQGGRVLAAANPAIHAAAMERLRV